MNIRQANSLSTHYALPQNGEMGAVEGKGLGGLEVKKGEGGIGRAFAVKTQGTRFKERTSHLLTRSKVGKDNHYDQRAERFNTRHQEFSGKVGNFVARLAQGNGEDVSNADVMATLRHDVKLLHRDAKWSTRENLLATRLDMELSQLSDEDLATAGETLKHADLSSLTPKDKADVLTMRTAVLRQEMARSPEMREVFNAIKTQTPGDVSGKDLLILQLQKTAEKILERFGELRDVRRHSPLAGLMLTGALSIALKRANLGGEELKGMNRNLLNIEYDLQKEGPGNPKNEIATTHPQLRQLSRAVREQFLETKVTTFQDTKLRSRLQHLGSGAAHEVTKGQYEVGEGHESRVHKHDDEELNYPEGGRFGAPGIIGIDQSNPRLLERAVFTSKLDEALGFNISVRTDFAKHRDGLGIVMTLGEGVTGKDISHVGPNPGTTQKELMKLQLLDIITGQTDRHRGNYMVEQGQDGNLTGVKGIDSDFCMGPLGTSIGSLLTNDRGYAVHYPPVVDTEMQQAIAKLTVEDLQDFGDGLFDDKTLETAGKRLEGLKEHLKTLANEGHIINSDQWGTEDVTARLTDEKTEVTRRNKKGEKETVSVPTSYWQRDFSAMQREFNEIGMQGIALKQFL